MQMDEKEEDDVPIESGFNYYLKNKWKLFVTLFCLFSYVTMGIQMEISGSIMLPLSRQLGCNLGELAWIVAARCFGFMITVILFGVIFQSLIRNHSELLISIGYLFPVADFDEYLATASTPYLKSLWSLSIALLFQGMLQGVSDLCINTLITTMWEDRSTAPLNCVYLGYAIGALLSVFLVGIFRPPDPLIVDPSQSSILIKEGQFQSELVGPYLITSIFCLISSIGFGLIAYKQHQIKKDRINIKQSIGEEEINIQSIGNFWKSSSPTTCGEGYFTYGFLLLSLLFLFNLFFGGIEQGFTKFFVSFLEKEEMNFNKKNPVYFMILYWLPMIIGRIICTIITASWISPRLMLTISLILSLLTYLFWIIFLWYIGLTSLSIFVLIILNGLSISSISPTFIGWIKQFLSLTPIELTYILISNAFGGILFGLFIGYALEYLSSKHLFTILILAVLSCSIVFFFIIFIQNLYSKKIQSMKQEEDKTLETFLNNEQSNQI